MANEQFSFPGKRLAFSDLNLKQPLSFENSMAVELSLLAGELQNHEWLDTIDAFVVGEPIPQAPSDTYIIDASSNIRTQLEQVQAELLKLKDKYSYTTSEFDLLAQKFQKRYDRLNARIKELEEEGSNHLHNQQALQKKIAEYDALLEEKASLVEKLENLSLSTVKLQNTEKSLNETIYLKQQTIEKFKNFLYTIMEGSSPILDEDLDTPEAMERIRIAVQNFYSEKINKELLRLKNIEQEMADFRKSAAEEYHKLKISSTQAIEERERTLLEYQRQAQAQYNEMETHSRNALTSLHTLQEAYAVKEAELAAVTQKFKETLQACNNRISEQNSAIENNSKSIQETNKKRLVELKNAQSQIQKMQTERSQLQQALSDSNNAVQYLKNSQRSLESQILQLKREVKVVSKASQQDQVNKLQDTINNLQRENFELARRNITFKSKDLNDTLNLLYHALKANANDQVLTSLNILKSIIEKMEA